MTRETPADMYTESESFSVRSVPWMKVGTVIEAPITAAEAMSKAGLDFDVELMPAGFQHGKSWIRAQGRAAIVRADTRQFFNFASEQYTPVQFREAFEFVDAISPEIVAAGSIRKGRQAFMVVRHPEHATFEVAGGDGHELYVVLRTSHDLSRAVEIFLMPLRSMCMNQLPLKSLGRNAQQSWSIRHVKSAPEQLAAAKAMLSGLDDYTAEFTQIADRLAAVELELREAEQLLEFVLPDRPKRSEVISRITGLFEHGETVGEAYHRTGWGLVNAVGEYFDHHRRGGSAESRFTNALSGSTNRYVNRTVQLLARR